MEVVGRVQFSDPMAKVMEVVLMKMVVMAELLHTVEVIVESCQVMEVAVMVGLHQAMKMVGNKKSRSG